MSYALAPMNGMIRGLTGALLLLPVAFVAIGVSASGPGAGVLLYTGIAVALLYLGVYLYSRPLRFEVDDQTLTVVWCIRRRRIERSTLRSVTPLGLDDFKARFGFSARIGVGGLWGMFGWLWTSQEGLLDVYVSRTDGWVIAEIEGARPLVLSPERPAEFVAVLQPPG